MKTQIENAECITCEFAHITRSGVFCRIGQIPDDSSPCNFRKESVYPTVNKKGGKYAKRAKGRKRFSKSFSPKFQTNP